MTTAATLIALAALVGAPSVSANLVFNGSFEMGTGGPGPGTIVTKPAGSTDIDGWTVGGFGVDWIDTGFWTASDGSRSLDLSAGSGGAVTASTAITTVVGEVYLLEFDMAGNTAGGDVIKSLIANVIDADNGYTSIASGLFSFDTTGKSASAMGWLTQSLLFTATSTSTVLGFVSLEPNPYGPALDNVRVDVAPAAIAPEPGTLAMAGTLVLAFAGGTRRARGETPASS